MSVASNVIAIDPDELVMDPDALALVDAAAARRHDVVPLGFDPGRRTLVLATPAPADVLRRDAVRALVDRNVRLEWRAAEPRFVAGALVRLGAPAAPGIVADTAPDGTRGDSGDGSGGAPDGARDTDVSGLVDALLHAAVAARASDLHLTPGPRATGVHHRVDGVLLDAPALPAGRHAALAVRLKVMAGLDIAECRLPQDGGFRRLVRARTVEFRLSSFPCLDGESLVLRVLDASTRPPDLDALGLGADARAALAALVERPGGLVVVAGPTGSGKSTTLHALLGGLVGRGLAIRTLEDPVEHRVEGVCQSSIDPARGLDHAAGVRALLRQDPDVLLIGEVRDAASCRMALRAAAAGHRVLTTVHAHDAIGALERLVELGGEDDTGGAASDAGDGRHGGRHGGRHDGRHDGRHEGRHEGRGVRAALARVLTGVAAQRLVGRPCERCAGVDTGTGTGTGTDAEAEAEAGAATCPTCRGRGLVGRFALVELLRATPAVREALRVASPASALREAAGRDGFVPLAELARDAVARGATTRAEALRTLGDAWSREGAT